jgi:hypothetical protein
MGWRSKRWIAVAVAAACAVLPDAQPDTLLLLGKGLTGAVSSFTAMFSPWADSPGGTG